MSIRFYKDRPDIGISQQKQQLDNTWAQEDDPESEDQNHHDKEEAKYSQEDEVSDNGLQLQKEMGTFYNIDQIHERWTKLATDISRNNPGWQ